MTNTAINDAENTTEVAPAEQTQTEVTSVDSVQPETTVKKRSTSAKAKANEDAAKTDAPEEIKSAEAPGTTQTTENQEQGPAEVKASAEAPEDFPKQVDDVKASHPPEAFLNRFNSKRKLEVKNNGPRSFEIFTNTPLPTGQTVVLELDNDRLFRMVVSKFTQLNRMAGKERYTFKEL